MTARIFFHFLVRQKSDFQQVPQETNDGAVVVDSDAQNVIRLAREGRGRMVRATNPMRQSMESNPDASNESALGIALVRRIGEGDRSAEHTLIEAFSDRLRYVLRRQMRSDQDVDDVLQSTFATVIVRLRERGIKDPGRLGGFVYRTAKNIQMSQRRRDLRQRGDVPPEFLDGIADNIAGPEEQTASAEVTRILHRLLDELSQERDREILVRRYLRQESNAHICAELDITDAHVRRVLSRARKRLKALVLKEEQQQESGLVR